MRLWARDTDKQLKRVLPVNRWLHISLSNTTPPCLPSVCTRNLSILPKLRQPLSHGSRLKEHNCTIHNPSTVLLNAILSNPINNLLKLVHLGLGRFKKNKSR
jgi:hypothetical protein